MKIPLRLVAIATASLTSVGYTKAGDLSKEEQALVDKGAFIEMYKPDEHSRHFIAHIDSVKDGETGKARQISKDTPRTVICVVFGIEDAKPAREEGRSMAECHYTPSQAHEFLFAEGWGKYHDRFFTRCYVQEGENAYDEVVKAQRKRIDPAATG